MSYITPHKALAHTDRLTAWKQGGTPAPVTLEWDLTNACSLGCQSCHFAHTHVKGPWAGRARELPAGYEETGTLADLALVRRVLAEAAQEGVRGVVWSGGGEPTLYPSWQEIVALAASNGLEQGMYTLGGHLSAEDAAFLAEKATWVVVSLDAADAETYMREKGATPDRFEAACAGINRLTGYRATVGVSFLLHELNWHRAHAMLLLARRLGATYATFRPTVETSPARPGVIAGDVRWVGEAMPTLQWLSQMPDVECSPDRFAQYAGWTGHGYEACHGIKLSANITPDGRIWVCPQRRGVAGSCIGDLRHESFAAVWARHPRQWTDFADCRAMCRFHLMNQALAPVFASYQHEAFV